MVPVPERAVGYYAPFTAAGRPPGEWARRLKPLR